MSADDDDSFHSAKMSLTSASSSSDAVCAWCGMAEVDNIKLEDCDGCDLVFCGREWCRAVLDQHDQERKKREAALHGDKLFKQPDETHLGECPLCFLPLQLDPAKSLFMSCCSKLICYGCDYADFIANGGNRCPFCREPAVDDEENKKRMMIRIKANDPAATCKMGRMRYHEGNYDTAFEYWTRAAELGNKDAHYNLGCMYDRGDGVDKNEEKAVYHYEEAAIGGHPGARNNLGCVEEENGNIERAVKHFVIAANLGDELSMKALWEHYKSGNITKEDLEGTLRTHQAAINEMKSPEREAAEAWRKRSAQRG